MHHQEDQLALRIDRGSQVWWFATAVAIAALALAALGWLVTVGPPALSIGITREPDDRWFVSGVTPGGAAWNDGVRPGMEVIGIDPRSDVPDSNWSSMLITDGNVRITIQRHDLPPPGEPLIAGGVALGLAVIAWRYLPSVAWWFILLPPILAADNGALLLDPPASLALLLAGPGSGVLYVFGSSARRSIAVAVAAVAVVALYAIAWALALAAPFEDWRSLRDLSVVVTIGLGALALAAALRAAIARANARTPALASAPLGASIGMVADELIPGRTRTRLTAIERERARLANELHADVLPDLSAVIRSIEDGASPSEAAERLRGIGVELRELMSELRLSVLESLGLVAALESLVEQVRARTGVGVTLEVVGAHPLDDEARPPSEVAINAYRICQQALDNALLHARPRNVRLLVDVGAGHAKLDVIDDGTGIRRGDEERALRAGHLGLVDMRQRAQAIGAAFRVDTLPEGGTVVELRWPA